MMVSGQIRLYYEAVRNKSVKSSYEVMNKEERHLLNILFSQVNILGSIKLKTFYQLQSTESFSTAILFITFVVEILQSLEFINQFKCRIGLVVLGIMQLLSVSYLKAFTNSQEIFGGLTVTTTSYVTCLPTKIVNTKQNNNK